jgi:hypothetical protein
MMIEIMLAKMGKFLVFVGICLREMIVISENDIIFNNHFNSTNTSLCS